MKQILLTIFLVLLIAIFATAGIQLSDNITRKGTGFNILTHLSMVGDTVGDSSCDDNNDLKIDRNWLDVYDSTGIDVDGGAFDYWLRPTYLREGSNVTFTVSGDTLTIAGSAGSVTLAGMFEFMDRTYFDTTTVLANDSLFVKYSDDVDTSGTKIAAALTARTTDTEFGKITDDSTHWNTAYAWGDWSVVMGKITDDTTSWKAAAESVAVWDNAGIASANITDQTITKNDIDTTSSNIPFNNAYKGTTATAESLLITHGEFSKVTDDSTALKAAKDSVAAWDNGDIFKKNVQSFSATIVLPKNVSDSVTAIPIFAVESGWAASGIYVHTVGIKTDNSSTYSVKFAEYTAPNTKANDIDTIATSTSYEAEGTPSDTAIAAGSIIYVIIPTTTGTKTLQVWGTWYKQ